jgi:gentisate 1,2-dioxygenase
MSETGYTFVDRSGIDEQPKSLLPSVLIKKAAIEAEISRLAAAPALANGRRTSLVACPATGEGNGLTPGIAVSLCVLKPGERTRPVRQNSFLVDFCIRGSGYTVIDGQRIDYHKFDVWTTPPWSVYEHCNDTDELQVRLSYSNAPLLEKLQVHIVEEDPQPIDLSTVLPDEAAADPTRSSPYGTFQLTDDGGYLMPYETLINPDHVQIRPLLWPWEMVKAELDKLKALGKSYAGRRLYLMYDPATGRTNGTTLSLFATITIRPANIVDRPHRHVSAAINYFFQGKGYSTVEGERFEWEAGDLMLSAPGWAVHNHASKDEDVYELTIQDQPMHLALGSLLWHEDLRSEPRLLGLSKGFATNRAGLAEVVSRK